VSREYLCLCFPFVAALAMRGVNGVGQAFGFKDIMKYGMFTGLVQVLNWCW